MATRELIEAGMLNGSDPCECGEATLEQCDDCCTPKDESSTHTPGEWEVSLNGLGVLSEKGMVADCSPLPYDNQQITEDEAKANARLIAAAPDLLEALHLHIAYEALPADRGGKDGPKGRAWAAYVSARDAAIAKATGAAS